MGLAPSYICSHFSSSLRIGLILYGNRARDTRRSIAILNLMRTDITSSNLVPTAFTNSDQFFLMNFRIRRRYKRKQVSLETRRSKSTSASWETEDRKQENVWTGERIRRRSGDLPYNPTVTSRQHIIDSIKASSWSKNNCTTHSATEVSDSSWTKLFTAISTCLRT